MSDSSVPLVAAIEAGGTKIVCALGRKPGEWLAHRRIPTRHPDKTLPDILDFFCEAFAGHGRAERLGLASFGPIRVCGEDAGTFLRTPKPGWEGFPLGARLREELGLEVEVATDVQAAALAEGRWGAARGLTDFIYITIGTGIGGGVVAGGRLVKGSLHPEVGHLLIPRHPDDEFAGTCPFHGTCWEGVACGPAIHKRWGREAKDLGPDHPALAMEAFYLAEGCWNLATSLAPQRIILGGGVMGSAGLLDRVSEQFVSLRGGYLDGSALEGVDNFLVAPGIDAEAGLWGAWLLGASEQAEA